MIDLLVIRFVYARENKRRDALPVDKNTDYSGVMHTMDLAGQDLTDKENRAFRYSY